MDMRDLGTSGDVHSVAGDVNDTGQVGGSSGRGFKERSAVKIYLAMTSRSCVGL